jgi:hypothetical protein
VIDQLGMYGDLVYNTPGLTDSQLLDFYKDASFGTPDSDIERVYSPTANVTVVRDASFGVPHIFGETRYATMFAQGYTAPRTALPDGRPPPRRPRAHVGVPRRVAGEHRDGPRAARVAPYRRPT